MSGFAIDHVTMGAASLEEGAEHVLKALGVEMPLGSKHDMMSTHNRVLRVAEGTFFELIAIDPDALPPGRPRWFALDDPEHRERLAIRPRPISWIVRTDDLSAVVRNSPVDLGPVVHFARADRFWHLTVRPDGTMPADGLIPSFIQWSEGPHPSANMTDNDLRLEKVLLRHQDPEWLSGVLATQGVGHLAEVSADNGHGNAIAFQFRKPDGMIVLLE